MTYNILDGGAKRLPTIAQVIKQRSPDYLTINEANMFLDKNIIKRFADTTQLPFFDVAQSSEFDYHVAIFSKYPLKKVFKLNNFMRACMVALIDSPLGELSIASLHLAPYSEDIRLKEIDTVLSFQNNYKNSILMGDFNSLSPRDNYNPEIVESFNTTQLKKFADRGKLRFDVVEKVFRSGYIDAALDFMKNGENTVPTPSSTDAAHAALRLDYIFLSTLLGPYLKEYHVIKNELTNVASDHFPVCVTLT